MGTPLYVGKALPDGEVGHLLGCGNPILDISAMVDKDMLDKYELENGAVILAEERHMPVYAELQEKYEVEYIAGGATQNTIRVAAWMLSGRKKRPECAYVGCVGNDEYGRKLAATCAAGGVHTNYQIDEETPTGTCAVLISRADGERTLVANLAAANNYRREHLFHDRTVEMIRGAGIVYAAGFFLTSGGVECIEHLGEHVHAGAGQERDIPNFKGSYLGRFPLVLADFWTSDHLSEWSRSVDAFLELARAEHSR